ncbi:Putative_U2 small nuclear ribonucleoprotein A [Hexamita inflata]|uniref:Leucine-rich repeat-containing protein 51 n=1 Tax=Hexamita inflata TaxID=28002 RepID=A0AA86UFS2_9EUKA|nr:Putative U2 small nuclear ribonucleoprotein A [Hexamita inflata]
MYRILHRKIKIQQCKWCLNKCNVKRVDGRGFIRRFRGWVKSCKTENRDHIYLLHLIYLDLRCNKLQSINGIEQLQTLKILYLHGNDIQSVTDLLPLKQMNLDALTVHGNPLVRQHNYKLFVINQLASLKRLDFGGIIK